MANYNEDTQTLRLWDTNSYINEKRAALQAWKAHLASMKAII